MKHLFAILLATLLAASAGADERSLYTLQSGSPNGPLTIHSHGIHGEGQLIALLDSGVDYDNCFFAEADQSAPPVNTGSPSGGLESKNIDLSRRKIVAYNFLFSCDQYPGTAGCDDPRDFAAYDNVNHGTRTAGAAAGDSFTPIAHDAGDGVAPAAKLIIQDGGYVNGDSCSQFPGLGCPITGLIPAFDQAYKQGARIHSNSWGDRQGVNRFSTPPTANYSASARDTDAFAFSHQDMLIVFNAGNAGDKASTVSSPGTAKNVLQVGGTGDTFVSDDTLFRFSGAGPTRDGRIKPDIVAPAMINAADAFSYAPNSSAPSVLDHNCDSSVQGGTSYASPTVAGAVALTRQYFVDGFYPTGVATAGNRTDPSAALLKAMLIASTRPVLHKATTEGMQSSDPAPAFGQGFGFPVLDDALYFPGDRARLRIFDFGDDRGLSVQQAFKIPVTVKTGTRLKATLVWSDPPGPARNATDPAPVLVNDLDLRITEPSGAVRLGNDSFHPAAVDRVNNVEVVTYDAPAAGTYVIEVSANNLGSGSRQGFALVLTGDLTASSSRHRAVSR